MNSRIAEESVEDEDEDEDEEAQKERRMARKKDKRKRRGGKEIRRGHSTTLLYVVPSFGPYPTRQ